MSPVSVTRVALLQGNATVARLMREFLEEESYSVELLGGSPPGAARAHLVILDVDSDEQATEKWLRHCDGRQLPVLVCGVERSRERFADRPWLSRPFSANQLLRTCREVLGVTRGAPKPGEGEQIPPPIAVGNDRRERPTREIHVGPELDEEPLTLKEGLFAEQSEEELFDVLDLNTSGSMILEIEDLNRTESSGGVLVGRGKRRLYTAEELADENPWAESEDTAVEALQSTTKSRPVPTLNTLEEVGIAAPSSEAEVTAISTWGEGGTGDFSSVYHLSSLLAAHWDRIGLTARSEDRADRVQRILSAMWRGGLEAVGKEIERLPQEKGFSGRLETLSLVALLQTIRDRGLRGRLEVGLKAGGYVLYVDGATLAAVDFLGHDGDVMLLELLRESGAIDEPTFARVRQRQKSTGEPLAMRLRRDGIVDETQLLLVRKERARRLFKSICGEKRGSFAFVEVSLESGQSWPTVALNLNVDTLLLETLRSQGAESFSERPLSQSAIVIDAGRAASLSPDALTESERRLLEFFQQGRSLESARRELGDSEEPVEQVVDRLKRLDLLRRLGQSQDQSAPRFAGLEEEDPTKRPTRVGSAWDIAIVDKDFDTADEPQGWPAPEVAGPEEETQQEVGFAAGLPADFDDWEEDIDEALSGGRKGRREPED